MAKFYDISKIIDKNYETNCFVEMNEDDFNNKIKEYINNHSEINTGDILFVGSTYETRQNYGFVIVDKRNGNSWYNSEQGIDLVFENTEFRKYLSSNGIKYQELFQSLNKYFLELSGYAYESDEVIESYQNNNLW